ncbi:hypothetical protein BRY73_08440 [Ochrobactrum sp. P6BS-III]|uniref:hypothetical protein n=1 Tax=unclassified Ochrobactrum TaxID=239106 RepID=UPI0009946CCC|nr:hypothetical protein [Ochrobactrum sp. P6BSIII]OOL18076.1 hypothetical protein BRY73_08440 [Ochrobactrum sp. P6BS-III]
MRKSSALKSSTSIRAEISALEQRSEALAERIECTESALASAKRDRVAALAADPTADIKDLSDRVRNNADDLALLEDAARDVDAELIEAGKRLVQAEDHEARSNAGEKLKLIAGALEPHASTIDRASANIAEAVKAIEALFPEGFALAKGVYGHPGSGRLHTDISGRDLALCIAVEALASDLHDAFFQGPFSGRRGYLHVLPRLFVEDGRVPNWATYGKVPAPKSAKQTAKVIGCRLIARAEAINAGEASPDIGRD